MQSAAIKQYYYSLYLFPALYSMCLRCNGYYHVLRASSEVRNLSWGALLRPEGLKFEAEGRERGRSSWGGAASPFTTS